MKVSSYYFEYASSTAATAADSYQSISHLGYVDTDGNDTVSVDSTYYFAPKKTMVHTTSLNTSTEQPTCLVRTQMMTLVM